MKITILDLDENNAFHASPFTVLVDKTNEKGNPLNKTENIEPFTLYKGGTKLPYQDIHELRNALEHISEAIININKAISSHHDLTEVYELDVAIVNLEMTKRIIQYGLT